MIENFRALSLRQTYMAGEVAAYRTFCEMRWPETDGEAICPRCGHEETYDISTRRKFKCKNCHQPDRQAPRGYRHARA